MEIKDVAVEQTTAKDTDYLVLQDRDTGIGYKITKVNFLAGLGTSNNTALLLDGIPTAVSARSTRQLLTAYTGKALQAMLVNGSTQDISFINGGLDTAALQSFAGSDSAYVSKFYDQVGGLNTTSTSRPKIIDAGMLQTAGLKPTVSYAGNLLSIPVPTGYPITIIAAIKILSPTNGAFIKYGGENNNGIGIGCGNQTFDSSGINLIGLNEAISWIPSSTSLSTSQISIVEINSTGNSTNIYLNGALVATGGGSYAGSGNYNIGGYGNRLANCNISEDIVFNEIISSATRIKIVSNMMTYYGIT